MRERESVCERGERESEGEREPRESTTILKPRPAELLHSLSTYVDVVHHARAVERPTRRAPPSTVDKGQQDKKQHNNTCM